MTGSTSHQRVGVDRVGPIAVGAAHLTKGMVGLSCLYLPAGVASLASASADPGVLLWALGLLLAFSAVSAYTYREVARRAAETGSETFAVTFERSGAGPAAVAAIAGAMNCLGACVSYAMVLGDAAVELLRHYGFQAELGAELPFRFAVITALSLGLLWPLCAKLDFRALRFTSVFGVCATAATAGVMAWRLVDGSYTTPDGAFAEAAAVAAALPVAEPPLGAVGGALVLTSLLANVFIGHHCAPQLRCTVERNCNIDGDELPGAVSSNFDAVIAGGFLASTAIYVVIMVCGYMTFGVGCGGNVLDEYAAQDPLAAGAKLATYASVLCSFPPMLLGLRDCLKDLFAPREPEAWWLSPPALLASTVLIAGLFSDLTSVMAVQGAILGSLLVYILPAMMVGGEGHRVSLAARTVGVPMVAPRPHHALIALGTFIGTAGVGIAALQSTHA